MKFTDDELQIVGYTGCKEINVSTGRLLYIIEGNNPYKMMDIAAEEIREEINSFELRVNKTFPEYFNYLGWCTWNAFYFDVNEEKYLSVLKEYKENGVQLGMTLIDDGWLTTDNILPIGARTLSSFEENKTKFKNGFKKLSDTAKNTYGIKQFMVWHASMGYWAGTKINEYKMPPTKINFPSCLSKSEDDFNNKLTHYPVNPENSDNFYNSFHKYLKAVGVDGVKIDVQYLIEGVEGAVGGRVKSFDAYQSSKEKSVINNFSGNAVNCMSCSNDMIYRMKYTNAIRSGNDYMPEIKNFSLICSNAYNSFWIYPISYTDWDMFFSNKTESYVDAIARIAGGSSICVSDEAGKHNYELLNQLSIEDGRVLRPLEPGRPTLDCLMKNPFEKDNILKVFNRNVCTYIIGVFNLNNNSAGFEVSPYDVDGIEDGDYIFFGFFNKEIRKINRIDKVSFNIGGESADLFTLSPCINGAAVIGLKNKINPSAAITEFHATENNIDVKVLTNGEYELYSEFKPDILTVNGKKTEYKYESHILSFSEYRL